jgi:hypothetical protein
MLGLSGQSITDVSGQPSSFAGTTGGGVIVSLTPTAVPGILPLTAFASAGPYTASSAAVLFALRRDETALVYTGKPVRRSLSPWAL